MCKQSKPTPKPASPAAAPVEGMPPLGTFSKAFQVGITLVLEHEGVLSDHSVDRGGMTKYGISARSYPQEDIPNLTVRQAIAIYHRDFWCGNWCDRIADLHGAVAVELFECGVNLGVAGGCRTLQKALNLFGAGLAEDGAMGMRTYTACREKISDDPLALLAAQNGYQFQHYVALVQRAPEQQVFLDGWLKRTVIKAGIWREYFD